MENSKFTSSVTHLLYLATAKVPLKWAIYSVCCTCLYTWSPCGANFYCWVINPLEIGTCNWSADGSLTRLVLSGSIIFAFVKALNGCIFVYFSCSPKILTWVYYWIGLSSKCHEDAALESLSDFTVIFKSKLSCCVLFQDFHAYTVNLLCSMSLWY